jgi:protein TonB
MRGPKLVRDVRAVYPLVAMQARVEGIVTVAARVEPNGRVSQVLVRRSVPLLDQAAIDAVRQYEFANTTLLNGVPVAVIVEIEVSFALR